MTTDHEPHVPLIHLLRGAPPVRSWSKHQETVPGWTLCGSRRNLKDENREAAFTTEYAEKVTCRFCLQLMEPEWRPTP